MAKSKKRISNLIKLSTDKERKARQRFTSGPAGNLALALRKSQVLFLGMIAIPIEQPGPQSYQQQAILALAQYTYKLSRCADLTISSGYALQSIPTVRAIYERVASALHARSDEQFAKDLIERNLKRRDVRDFVGRAKEGFPPLLDEYLQMRRQPAISQSLVNELKESIPRLYGVLSDFAHPRKDAIPWYFLVDPSTGKAVFKYFPDEEASPFANLLLSLLWVMQFTLQTLLLVEFCNEGEKKWEMLVNEWEKSVHGFVDLIEPNMKFVQQYIS